jgi:hypothetical protein
MEGAYSTLTVEFESEGSDFWEKRNAKHSKKPVVYDKSSGYGGGADLARNNHVHQR